MAKSTFSPVKSADRVFDVLEELLKHPDGIPLRELGKSLDIADSSMHALVNTMLHRKYIRLDDRRKLFLGNKFYMYANAAASPLISCAKPYMKQLKKRFNENVHLALLDGWDVVYVAYEQSTHPIRFVLETGRTQPAHITGVGKMLLSAFTDEQIADLYQDYTFERYTARTLMNVGNLIEKLREIRQNGYALDNFESYEGAKCFAAPIYNSNGTLAASLSISIPQVRLDENRDEEMIRAVIDTARQVSELLND